MPYSIIKEESYANFQGINNKASRKVTGKNQVLNLANFDLSTIGSLSKRPGTTMLIGATLAGRISSFYEYDKLGGGSYLIVSAGTNVYARSGGSWNAIRSGVRNDSIFDFVTFVDYLFAANGYQIFKYDGINAVAYSLPPGATLNNGGSVGPGGVSGAVDYSYGFLNDRGYYGPAINITTASFTGDEVLLNGFSTPLGFGITALIIYRGYSGAAMVEVGSVPAGTASFNDLGASYTERLANDNLFFQSSTGALIQVTDNTKAAPRSLELWNNQLFLVSFPFPQSELSTFRYSAIGEPEGVPPENFEEVRTNDGDILTAAKAFGGQLVVCKGRSTHALTGNDPDNFELREVSDQYGCISPRAIAVFDQKCWYLDQKGICEFDGSNTRIVSTSVEETFAAMNLPVAKELAQMFHVKHRNEVWCNIPTNGASFLNTIVVYDYDVQGWWTVEGIDASAMGIFTNDMGQPTTGFGDFSGAVSYFGASLMSDNQRGMTCRVRFPFKAVEESATEHQFRRLWLDTDPQYGGTKVITVNMYKDQGNTPVLSRTIYQSEFQTRTEFGIPAKDLSIELIFSEASPLRINGYTLGHRFQRDV